MTDLIVAIVLLTVIVVGLLAVQLVNGLARRRWRAHEQYPFLATDLGLERVQDRFIIDTRIQRYRGNHRGRPVEVEVGSGGQGVYLRVDLAFEKPVDLGLRISSEHEDGFMTRALRLREIEVGHHGFDSQFVLLSRDEARLKELLDHNIRRMLVDLKERVRDLRLNDDGLHVQMFGVIEPDLIRETLDRGAQLVSTMFERAAHLKEQRREELAAAEAFSPVTGSMAAIKVPEDAR